MQTSAPNHQIRAVYTESTIRVYQAFGEHIAEPAVRAQTFRGPFSRDRMTWIKPSFLWMMYRCGWGQKPSQERVLAIDITREGFEWALAHSALSHFDRKLHTDNAEWQQQVKTSPVRIQWDPERDFHFNALPYRSIQIGLGGESVARYVDNWIKSITDVTELAHEMYRSVADGDLQGAKELLPAEVPYPLPEAIAQRIGAEG